MNGHCLFKLQPICALNGNTTLIETEPCTSVKSASSIFPPIFRSFSHFAIRFFHLFFFALFHSILIFIRSNTIEIQKSQSTHFFNMMFAQFEFKFFLDFLGIFTRSTKTIFCQIKYYTLGQKFWDDLVYYNRIQFCLFLSHPQFFPLILSKHVGFVSLFSEIRN